MKAELRCLTVLFVLSLLAAMVPAEEAYPAGPARNSAALPVSLRSALDNDGIAGGPGRANFDGVGFAYPASKLPRPGQVRLGGVRYTFPRAAGPDNVVALGQTIPIPRGEYGVAYVLVASTWGDTSGEVTVHYADGGTTSAEVNAPDWHDAHQTGIIATPFRYTQNGVDRHPAFIFAVRFWIDPFRTAVSITLPMTHAASGGQPSMHFFALSLQPVIPGVAAKVVGARTTTNTIRGASQVVEATIENNGTDWFSSSNRTVVTVRGKGLNTVKPAVITALAPGDQMQVEIGVRMDRHLPRGHVLPAWVVAHPSSGVASDERISLRVGTPRYAATNASLARHDTPDWFDAAKFGIFIHYGLYSIPAWAPVGGVYAEWYWHSMQEKGSPTYQHQLATYGPDSTYDGFIPQFTAARFDPRAWVELFKQAGARYFVFVAKHHDGFALFQTRYSHRNSVDMGPHRDLVRLLFQADRKYTPEIHPGLYYSLPEWYNPSFPKTYRRSDHFPGGPPLQYVTGKVLPYTGYVPVHDYVRDFQVPQMKEMIDRYRPDILWCDIGGPNDSLKVIAHYYNGARTEPHPHQVAVNNRCGVRAHDFTTPEYHTFDSTMTAKWEATRGIDPHSFGYNANTPDTAYATSQQLIDQLVDVVSKNGNFLLDIGPRADGTIPDVMQGRLRDIGAWLRVSGEAIYDTTPWWRMPQEGDLRFTVRPNRAFYITSLTRPGDHVTVAAPVPIRQGNTVSLLGWDGPPLQWSLQNGKLRIDLPPAAQLSGQNAWVFKIAW